MTDPPRGPAGPVPAASATGEAQRRGVRPPGRRFHGLLVALTLALLWSVSVPGASWFVLFGAVAGLLVCAAVWLTWLITYAGRRPRWSWSVAVAPVGALLVYALVVTSAPLHARWLFSRGAFDDQAARVRTATPAGMRRLVPVPARLGLYRVTEAQLVPGGVLFYEATGNLVGDAGFAHLPDGPARTLEFGPLYAPTFEHLGGPWYAWREDN